MIRRPPRATRTDTLLPYTTLFRSNRPSAHPSRRREGSFVAANPFMPGLRVREDGWTAARTRRFLAVLAQSGCVSDAARVAGMSRKSVNDARRRFADFDRACSTALASARRGQIGRADV